MSKWAAINALGVRVSALEDSSVAATAANDEVLELQNRLRVKNEGINLMQVELGKLTSENVQLRKELKAANLMINNLNDCLNSAENQIHELMQGGDL